MKYMKNNNPVAKYSRNKAGAGAHKSKKDYDRKQGQIDMGSMEVEIESWANKIDRMILLEQMQKVTNSVSRWQELEEDIITIREELEEWQTTE